MQDCQAGRAFSLDTETKLIGRGEDLAPPLVCASYCEERAELQAGLRVGADVLPLLRSVACNDTLTVVGAKFEFDAHVIARRFPEYVPQLIALYDSDRIHDVQIIERLRDISRGQLELPIEQPNGKKKTKSYSLSALYAAYGYGALDKSEDTWRLRYGELLDVPLDQWPRAARDYAELDAVATLRVYQSQRATQNTWKSDISRQVRGAFALQKVSLRGLVTDGSAVRSYIQELKQQIQTSRVLLEAAGIVRANGSRDTKRAQAHMRTVCAQLGITPKLTASGAVSLDLEACRAAWSDVLVRSYSLYSTSDTLLTRAEQLIEGSRGLPLQSEYVALLENGRTSSRIPRPPLVGVQTQNLPREGKLRECFVPRPGYYFLSIDFNSDEIACFAQAELLMTGSSKLAEALQQGLDVHCVLAAALLEEPYDVVYANRKHGKYAKARQLAKIGNFGCLGGMSARTMWLHANRSARRPEDRYTLAQIQRVHRVWYQRWQPQAYFEQIKSALGPDQWSGLCAIEQLQSGRIRGALSYTEAANTIFSGLAADSNKDVLYQCVRATMLAKPGDALWDVHVVNMLHDELFFEVPTQSATRASKALCELMLSTKSRWLPSVPSGAEPALMERWYKAAEPVWSPAGELLPWRPTVLQAA